jgi:flagellar L-ring protein FlgH
MKTKIILILTLVLCLITSISAQQKSKAELKKEKKERERLEKIEKARTKDIPEMTVVRFNEQSKSEAPNVSAAIIVPTEKPLNGSLFTDSATNGNLLVDFKARRIGDLVFVDVVETNTATVNSSATRSRDSGNIGGLGALIGAIPVPGAAAAASVTGALGTRKFDGKGTTQRTSSVTARITARVVEVLPNGDLRVEALKLVRINKETEQLALTGIVRQKDLASDNSVETISIGDLRVEFNGKGIASADNGPGWLFKFFEKISPF